jgi:hypothetical protein
MFKKTNKLETLLLRIFYFDGILTIIIFIYKLFCEEFFHPSYKNGIDIYSAYVYSICFVYFILGLLIELRENSLDDRVELIYPLKVFLYLILHYFSYDSFFVYEMKGVICFLSFSFLSFILCLILCIPAMQRGILKSDKSIKSRLSVAAIAIIPLGVICYGPFKDSYRHEFGIEEFGHEFEKTTYEAKYYVQIKKSDNEKMQTAPADIIVSDDFNEYEDSGDENSGGYTTKKVKVNTVFIHGKYIYFEDCFPEKKGAFCECLDQNNESWDISITREKVE